MPNLSVARIPLRTQRACRSTTDTPLTTTSFSCWRSPEDSRAFAFASGHHPDAYKIDRAEQRHSTEFTVRFRPLHSEGTFDGVDPLAILRQATAREAYPR